MIRACACLAAACFLAGPALAGDAAVGHYHAAEGPDVASELILKPDGHFEYGLIAGALDLQAKGRWVRAGDHVELFTEPRPVPPVFAAGTNGTTNEEALTVLVSWPNGRGIAGINLLVGFAQGEPVDGYTQDYGWSLPADEKRTPQWIELSLPMFGLVSSHFPIDAKKANALRFTLVPNDLGTVDFQGARVDVDGSKLTLTYEGDTFRYVRDAGR